MKFSDIEIIEGLKAGNRDVLEAVYKSYWDMVKQLIVLNSGSEDEAKDIYQEVVLIILNKAKSGSLVLNCKLKTYVYSVSRNLWLKQLNYKGKFAGKVEDHDEFISIDENDSQQFDDQQNKHNKMREALEKLGEPCKTLIADFYLENKSMIEITDKFGYSGEDSAKTQKYKCMNRLKRLFFELYKDQN